MAETAYVVLRQSTADPAEWIIVEASIDAHSSAGAIRQVAARELAAMPNAGAFVAVPDRSWKPTKVSAQTQTILKLDTA